MQLHSPFIITARLLPGVQVGDGFLSIEYGGHDPDGRTVYRYHIDIPGHEYTGSDLRSGCQGGDLQSGMESLLTFMSACGESYAFTLRTGKQGENTDLFPPAIAEWCYRHSDELSMLAIQSRTERAILSPHDRAGL